MFATGPTFGQPDLSLPASGTTLRATECKRTAVKPSAGQAGKKLIQPITGWNSSATTAAHTLPRRRAQSPVDWACRRSTRQCAVRRATAWPRVSSTHSSATMWPWTAPGF